MGVFTKTCMLYNALTQIIKTKVFIQITIISIALDL